jgi:urease accessory protein
MKNTARLFQWLGFAIFAQPLVANAHPLHWPTETSGLISGLIHPLSSSDHIITMLVVGFWLFQLTKKAAILLSAVFVCFMLVGCSLTLAPIEIAYAEKIMNAFAVLLGLVLVSGYTPPTLMTLFIISNLALFHGYVHAYDIWLDKNGFSFTLGFSLTSLALILVGMAIEILIDRYTIKNTTDYLNRILDQ